MLLVGNYIFLISGLLSKRNIYTDQNSDTPHTIEQLRTPDMTTSLVQPLSNSFYTSEDFSIGKYKTWHSHLLLRDNTDRSFLFE
jgi:hypothetical protein